MEFEDEFWRTRPLQYALALFYSFIVVLFWLPAFAVRHLARFAKEAGVEGWPPTNGSITGGDVKVIHGWILDYAVGHLDYSYRVHGEYYAGGLTRQYADEQAAWDFVDACRGRDALIRYRDDKAQISVLREADQQLVWNFEPVPGFFVQLWRHWCDQLRPEPKAVSDDEES
jgi:hypothetical protein